jgi:hypothetical protein
MANEIRLNSLSHVLTLQQSAFRLCADVKIKGKGQGKYHFYQSEAKGIRPHKALYDTI